MGLESIRQILTTIVPTVGLVAVLLENLDTDDIELDDEAARAAQQFNKSVKALLGSLPESSVARGYEQTKAFCDNVKNSCEVIIAGDLPRKAKLEQCELLFADLSDPRKVYQARNGRDAAYLLHTKEQVRALIDAI